MMFSSTGGGKCGLILSQFMYKSAKPFTSVQNHVELFDGRITYCPLPARGSNRLRVLQNTHVVQELCSLSRKLGSRSYLK